MGTSPRRADDPPAAFFSAAGSAARRGFLLLPLSPLEVGATFFFLFFFADADAVVVILVVVVVVVVASRVETAVVRARAAELRVTRAPICLANDVVELVKRCPLPQLPPTFWTTTVTRTAAGATSEHGSDDVAIVCLPPQSPDGGVQHNRTGESSLSHSTPTPRPCSCANNN